MNTDVVHKYINLVIEKEHFVKSEIKTPGQTGKGDGFMSRVVFVTVDGVKQNGEKKTLNYVVKVASSSKSIREKIPLAELFATEIFLYENILPEFRKFQNEMSVKIDLLNFLPPSHFSNRNGDQEIVILENMKSLGFDTWNKIEPMPYEYIKVILENYGKWHAFSFAFKSKHPASFTKLEKGIKFNGWYGFVSAQKLLDTIYKFFDEFRDNCQDEQEIIHNLKFTKNDVQYICGNLFLEDFEDRVIAHGDGWTNNFMFKTTRDNTSTSACFLDWQYSALASPVFDLSYFIYTCVDTKKYSDVEELLKIYYASFSNSLKLLGCDASIIFPYNKLIYHWTKFSASGLVIGGSFVLKFVFAEADEAPDLEEIVASGRDAHEFFNFTIKRNKELLNKRTRNNFLHYIRNLKKVDI